MFRWFMGFPLLLSGFSRSQLLHLRPNSRDMARGEEWIASGTNMAS